MILVWDNGCGHSDHAVYFVDIGDLNPDAAIALYSAVFGGSPVLLADRVEWRDGGADDMADAMVMVYSEGATSYIRPHHADCVIACGAEFVAAVLVRLWRGAECAARFAMNAKPVEQKYRAKAALDLMRTFNAIADAVPEPMRPRICDDNGPLDLTARYQIPADAP